MGWAVGAVDGFLGALGGRRVVEEEVTEVVDGPAEAASVDGTEPVARAVDRLAETVAERVREAAEYKLVGYAWEFLLRDVSARDEITWLGALPDRDLKRIAVLKPVAIAAHLAGTIPISGLPPIVRTPGTPFVFPEPAADPERPDSPYCLKPDSRTGAGGKRPRSAAVDALEAQLQAYYAAANRAAI